MTDQINNWLNLNRSQLKQLKAEIKLLQKVISWIKYKNKKNLNQQDNSSNSSNSKYSIEDITKVIKSKFPKEEIQNLWLGEITRDNFEAFVNFYNA